MHSPSTPSAPYQSSMPSFRPGAPPQSSMQSRATPSAPYQSSKPNFRPNAPSQAKTSSTTQFAPSQTRMHQSSPNVTPDAKTKSTFIHSYTQQHSSIQATPHQLSSTTQNLGAHQNSNNSNLKPRQKKTRFVTSKTLTASKNASRYIVGVNHLCKVQGSEESTSSFFLCLFYVFMVIGLLWNNALYFVESDNCDYVLIVVEL